MNEKLPFSIVDFDADALNQAIKANGVTLQHFKAIKCPIGKIDPLDTISPHGEHDNLCSNGFIYIPAGQVTVFTHNNSAMINLSEGGILDGSTIQVTFPQFYDDYPDKPVSVQIYDRFYIKDLAVVVPNTQLFEAHPTGIDRFNYKIEKVEYIIDAQGKQYSPSDYSIKDGRLYWVTDNRPKFDANLNKGEVVSIRYLYTPFFYVNKILHEVRLIHKTDFITGQRQSVRAPYEALLSREYYLYKEQNTGDAPVDSNRVMSGTKGSIFGAH